MTDDEFLALLGLPHEHLVHAQACLDLFEKDWGRRAAGALDLRHWADLQGPDSLRFRLARRVRAQEKWARACRTIWQNVPAPLASRPPLGQRVFLTLAQAARATGRGQSAILAAIADGRIAAMQDIMGDWHIERAELMRAFAPAGAAHVDDDSLDAATLLVELGLAPVVSRAAPRHAHHAGM
jgi:hypothetical protein